ncbi:hypothetical protein KIPB_003096, partial [Kipferlia bialata]
YHDHFIDSDKGRFKDWMVIVMEYCDGISLLQVSAPYQPVTQAEIERSYPHLLPGKSLDHLLVMAEQILKGLSELHRNNIAHRDIKPANIMVCKVPGSDVPCCKLIDLGLSRLFKPDESMISSFADVSPLYSAPEKFTGGYTLSVDIWALGITLSQLCTPKCVLDYPQSLSAVRNRLMRGDPRRLTDLETGVPGLARVINSMLERDTERRPTAPQALDMIRSVHAHQLRCGSIDTVPLSLSRPSIPSLTDAIDASMAVSEAENAREERETLLSSLNPSLDSQRPTPPQEPSSKKEGRVYEPSTSFYTSVSNISGFLTGSYIHTFKEETDTLLQAVLFLDDPVASKCLDTSEVEGADRLTVREFMLENLSDEAGELFEETFSSETVLALATRNPSAESDTLPLLFIALNAIRKQKEECTYPTLGYYMLFAALFEGATPQIEAALDDLGEESEEAHVHLSVRDLTLSTVAISLMVLLLCDVRVDDLPDDRSLPSCLSFVKQCAAELVLTDTYSAAREHVAATTYWKNVKAVVRNYAKDRGPPNKRCVWRPTFEREKPHPDILNLLGFEGRSPQQLVEDIPGVDSHPIMKAAVTEACEYLCEYGAGEDDNPFPKPSTDPSGRVPPRVGDKKKTHPFTPSRVYGFCLLLRMIIHYPDIE